MTRESHAADPAEPSRAVRVDPIRLVGRIKASLRKHQPYWETLPFRPPLDPFSRLGEDLGRLRQFLSEPSSPLEEDPGEAVVDLLEDSQFPEVVNTAFVTVTAYVHFRERLNLDAPAQPFPRWLREESEESTGALFQLCESLRPLRHSLQTLTPLID